MRYRQILEACWTGYKRVPGTKEGTPGSCKKISEQELEEDLHKWFKEKWVRFGPDGKIRGACARGSDSEGKPKCLPQSKAHSLGKKGRASAASRKRREDPNPERSGPAINVNTKKKSNEGVAEGSEGSWVVYDGAKIKRFKTHEGAKAYAEKNGGKVASSEYYHDKLANKSVAEEQLDEKWSKKYKDSINCSNPKGFSQKAHCAGKKK